MRKGEHVKHVNMLILAILVCGVTGCQTKTGGEAEMKPEGPCCQSCAMPLEKHEHYGTDANGTKVDKYCHFCLQNGKFTDPNVTMQEMINKVSSMLAQHSDMTETQAKEMMSELIPKLDRWQTR